MTEFTNLHNDYPSKTAPFDYSIIGICKPLEINQIIKDDKGKKWQVKGISHFKAYVDNDDYRKTELSGEFFTTSRATFQNCTVIEFYERHTMAYQIFRKQVRNVQLRVS